MKGSVLIVLLFIMMAMSFLIVTTASVVSNHFMITHNDDSHQKAYFLAEAGINSAFSDLSAEINNIHEATLSSFKWDPLINPTVSIQEGGREHIKKTLGAKLQNTLTNKKFLKTSYIREPELPGLNPDEAIDVQINITNGYTFDPIVISIVSRSRIGNIKRRIDAVLNINKVSQIFDSALFNFSLLCSGELKVHNGGQFTSLGDIYPQNGINIGENGMAFIKGSSYVKENIRIVDGIAAFQEDVISNNIEVEGTSSVVFENDVYVNKALKSTGSASEVIINGSFYSTDSLDEAGLKAEDDSTIIVNDEIYINGTSGYEEEEDNMESFFASIKLKMERLSGWNYKYQLNENIPVPTKNVILEELQVTTVNPDEPIILMIPENRDIILPSGNYSGIIFTNGSVIVKTGDIVYFDGLVITGGIDISGNFILRQNKKLIYMLLENNSEALMNFFKIQKEKPFIEIKTWNERLYNDIIN